VNDVVHPVSCTSCRICHNAQESAKSERKQGLLHQSTDHFQTKGEERWPLKTLQDTACLARTVEATRVAQGHLLNARSSRSRRLVRLHWH
jgi:hypothetical protein